MTIRCSGCGDAIETTNSEGFHIRLANAETPRPEGYDGSVTDMHITPMLKADIHFHGFRCLGAWAKHQLDPYSGKPIIE